MEAKFDFEEEPFFFFFFTIFRELSRAWGGDGEGHQAIPRPCDCSQV